MKIIHVLKKDCFQRYAKSIFNKIEKEIILPFLQAIKTGNPQNILRVMKLTLSVYDQYGNAVSSTYTINSAYGSKK